MQKIIKRFLWLGIPLLILATVILNPNLNRTPTLLADDSPQLFLPIVKQGAETTPPSQESEPIAEASATPQPETSTPDPAVVWPELNSENVVQARAGQEFQITGSGGYLLGHDGNYNETAQYFDLYFNDELIDALLCYVNHCQSNFTIPADIQPGSYELYAEGGSSLTVQIMAGEPTTPGSVLKVLVKDL